jgi:pyruvate,water dikinase
VAAFRALLRYVQRFFLYRDNQRHYFDRYTFSLKRGAVEFGRRLKARGVLARAEDVYFSAARRSTRCCAALPQHR